MGMSSKEKSKRYRDRLKQNPEKYDERKRKKRESYHKNKKLLSDLKPQEKVNCRIIWKLRKQEQRKRKKAIQELLNNTPPSSPSILLQQPINQPLFAPIPPDSPAESMIRGRKKIPKTIVPLVGTTRVHQVFSNIRGQLKYRDLSCFCERGFCECLNPKLYYPIPVPKSNNTTHKVCDFDDNLSNDNFPLSHMLTSSHENDISFKDFRTSVSKNMYKRVYRSSDTSENNTDEDEQNEAHNILPGLRDSEGEQSTLKQYNVFGYYDDKLTSKVYDNLPKFDLSGLYVSRQNDNLPTYDLPGGGDEQQPSTSGQQNNLPGRGDYLLVKVYGAKGKSYSYCCVAQSDIEDDGEIKVTFLKAVKRGKLFILNQKDISYVAYEDIIRKLPNPDVEYKRGEVYYKFPCNVEVFEK
ncbi:unnamed protein product [Parnassius apollo]|uniref:(apollo) hypothetical protein n=1 Tax=Parnassius apollo TaxID=110799 RepID=A0A8S3Y1S8_PARAO|nr:unnamed protein product [Parnassius apollo]